MPGGFQKLAHRFGFQQAFAVNAGPGAAVRWLQTDLDTTADGVLGPLTLAAVQAADPATVIRNLTTRRLTFYQSLNKPRFILGWTSRATSCEAAALALIAP